MRANHRINTNSQLKRPSAIAAGYRIVLGAALAACATLAHAAGYKIVELGTLSGANTSAYAINDEGTIVGSSVLVIDSVEHDRATMWKNGQVIDLGSVDDTDSRAYAINAHGKVTGSSRVKPSIAVEKAVKWHGDTIKRLKPLGGGFSQGRGINQKGVFVGYSQTRTADRPALWDETGVHALPTLGGESGGALGINRSGLVVGYTETAAELPTEHAVLWDANRQPVDLGTLGGKSSVAFAINDAGTHRRHE